MKIKTIKKHGESRVINLTVHKNHTFVTSNGIVTHNCDHFSRDGQAAFRGFIDEFSKSCTFIFTANFKNKLIEPLLDRLQVYDFNTFSKEEMIKPIFERLKWILENEKVEFDPKDLVPVIQQYYPRIRSMVGALQKYTENGHFKVIESELDDLNQFDNIMAKNNPKMYTEMIVEVNKLNAPDNMYSYLYKNGAKFFKPEHYPNMVLIIAKYQSMSSQVRDKNLNLSACLTELMKLRS